MNYVGTCFFDEVGRCLCSLMVAGSGSASANQQTGVAFTPDPRLFQSGLTPGLTRSAPASTSGSAPNIVASNGKPGGGFVETLFDLGATGGPSPHYGGAPMPEVNAGIGLLLAGLTVAVLRRKRGRQMSRAT